MRKLAAANPVAIPPAPRRWCAGLVRAVGLGLVTALVCDLARGSILAWQALGRHESAAFDSVLYDAARALGSEAWRAAAWLLGRGLHSSSWKPNWVIPFAVGWVAIAGWLLRAGRR